MPHINITVIKEVTMGFPTINVRICCNPLECLPLETVC